LVSKTEEIRGVEHRGGVLLALESAVSPGRWASARL
jgi:hypothetical protein